MATDSQTLPHFETNDFARSSRFIQIFLALFYAPLRLLFRVEVEGREKILDEPCLYVSNHNIGAVVECLALLNAWEERFAETDHAPVYALGHRFGFRIPGVAWILRSLGVVPAKRANADLAFKLGYSVTIFPGGNREVVRPFSQRYVCDFGGKRGWIRVAKENRKRIVPITVAGSHSVNPVLFRSRTLARVLLVDPLLRLKWFPVTLAQLVYPPLFFLATASHLPNPWRWGLTAFLFFASALIPIWPAKIRIVFHDPISFEGSEDEIDTRVQETIASRLRH